MEGSTGPGRRTLTPAVLASALFVAACAVFAVTFVAARGGLSMPLAPTAPPIAQASQAPSIGAPPTAGPTEAPTSSPAVTAVPTVGPTVAPTQAPTPTPAGTPDPLAALPGCPDQPGCYEYLIERGDTLNAIANG